MRPHLAASIAGQSRRRRDHPNEARPRAASARPALPRQSAQHAARDKPSSIVPKHPARQPRATQSHELSHAPQHGAAQRGGPQQGLVTAERGCHVDKTEAERPRRLGRPNDNTVTGRPTRPCCRNPVITTR